MSIISGIVNKTFDANKTFVVFIIITRFSISKNVESINMMMP